MKKQIILMLSIILSTLFVTAQTTPTSVADTVAVTTEQPATGVDSPIVITDPISVVDPSVTIAETPDLIDGIFNKPGNNPVIYLVIGLLSYLAINYRRMKLRFPTVKFNITTWFQGNYIKIILYLLFVAYMLYAGPHLNNFTAFAIGFVPAKGIDWIKKELNDLGIEID